MQRELQRGIVCRKSLKRLAEQFRTFLEWAHSPHAGSPEDVPARLLTGQHRQLAGKPNVSKSLKPDRIARRCRLFGETASVLFKLTAANGRPLHP